MTATDTANTTDRTRFFARPPMFPPALPVGADLTVAYDAACERYARDGVETDRIEAQRLGAELDRK